jgi:hypothetical protein
MRPITLRVAVALLFLLMAPAAASADPRELDETPRVTLRLSTVALAPSTPLEVKWRLAGRLTRKPDRRCEERRHGRPCAPELALQLRIRAPGAAPSLAGARWTRPGVLPPTGAVFYLASDGSWRDEPVAYLDRARSGGVELSFPGSSDGAWLVEVLMVDPATGDVEASGADTVVVGREAGIYLRLSRPIANSLDAVRATLVTTAGETRRRVRLLAWLVKPDGRRLGLPTLVPDAVNLYAGRSRTTEIQLLDRFMGPHGLGAYQVQVRLYDADTHALLGRASAGFEVCDTRSTLRGVVRTADGAAFGPDVTVATVQALDLDERAITAAVPLDTRGAYTLTLDPGRYLVRATVQNAGGTHTAEAPELVEVGCHATTSTLDLTEAGR